MLAINDKKLNIFGIEFKAQSYTEILKKAEQHFTNDIPENFKKINFEFFHQNMNRLFK